MRLFLPPNLNRLRIRIPFFLVNIGLFSPVFFSFQYNSIVFVLSFICFPFLFIFAPTLISSNLPLQSSYLFYFLFSRFAPLSASVFFSNFFLKNESSHFDTRAETHCLRVFVLSLPRRKAEIILIPFLVYSTFFLTNIHTVTTPWGTLYLVLVL